MLRKLMKHEFRATGRIMLPLFLLVFVTAVGANISVRQLMEVENQYANILGILLLSAFVIAIVGVCVVVFLLMVQRFQKNLLSDEGYVMLTLPASVHQHVWSKMLVSTVWFAATVIVVGLSAFVMVYEVGLVKTVFSELCLLFEHLEWADMPDVAHIVGYILELVLLCVVISFELCLEFYSAMAIGHSFANHKVLFSVVAFFSLEFVLDALSSVILTILGAENRLELFFESFTVNTPAQLHLVLLAAAGLVVLYAAVFYVVTVYFMQKRINLE